MSYESRMFEQLQLPKREKIIDILLLSLLKCDGSVSEFGSGNQEFSDELADQLALTNSQRRTTMETIVRKEGRVKTFPAWHRLLYRSAALAASKGFLSHPSRTFKLIQKKEWMLTEKGIDRALKLSNIPSVQKKQLPVKTFEVETIKKHLEKVQRVENYDPVDPKKKITLKTTRSLLRARGFRQAVIEAYEHRCSVCGLKIQSADYLSWEVEAAHIVPSRLFGKDDIWNGIALCRLHHWAFDVGWFSLQENLTIKTSNKITLIPPDQGRASGFDLFRDLLRDGSELFLPSKSIAYPHHNSIIWHRKYVFQE